jgi:hypothetical protein
MLFNFISLKMERNDTVELDYIRKQRSYRWLLQPDKEFWEEPIAYFSFTIYWVVGTTRTA